MNCSTAYGEKKLYEGGLSVRATLDPTVQMMARHALADGLVRYDEARGFHGPIKHIEIGQDWGPPLAALPALGDVGPWRLAVVLEADDQSAAHGLQPKKLPSGDVEAKRETGVVLPVGLKWAHRRQHSTLATGDIIYVEPIAGQPGQYRLRPNAGSWRRHRRHGSGHRPRPRHGRRLFLRSI